MKIRYLDGVRLKQAIIAGTNVVNKMQDHLNKINVFPVADGDTGLNMASTMNYISEDLASCSHRSIGTVSLRMARSALMGAQGNSGVILAQFFNGFAESLNGKLQISTKAFADAVRRARISAYKAMSDPREGTILTVIKDWSRQVEELCHKHSDFADILQKSLITAHKSLADTPKKLKVLAKAGVVDAGAQGFVHLLEGITHFIDKGKIVLSEKISDIENMMSPTIEHQQLEYQYCTECVFTSQEADREKLESLLKSLGNSLIVANTNELFRVHIHTNEPETVFSILEQYGKIEKRKVDDMSQQHAHFHPQKEIGIVTDSACDLPESFLKENDVHIIPTRLAFGPETFRDKIDITTAEFYAKLVKSEYHPTSSQPALGAYKEVYEHVIRKYKQTLSIHLPSVASGTFQSAVTSAETFGENRIICIDGKTVSIALGLVIMEAVEAIKEGCKLEEVIKRTETAIRNVYLYVPLPTLEYLLKGGRVSKQKYAIAKVLNLKPIVTFDRGGHVKPSGKAFGYKSALKKALNLATKKAKTFRKVKFMVAHTDAVELAEWLVVQLKQRFDVDDIPIVEAAPVLGVHAGPGAAAVAFLGYN
ncbi:DegV family EDD domain-containing protein [candidate division KSB1 bacterium]|nr:DegV family EDD domain-containing protein [candidate division KSB1 bacterium]